MRTMVAVALLAAVVAQAEVVHVGAGPDGNGGVQAQAAVDLLALTPSARAARAQRRAETQARRENMTVTEKTADHLKENWGKYAAAASVIVVDRVAANNDWLWYDWLDINKGKSGGKKAGGDVVGDDTSSAVIIANTINGDGNTINQTIIVQMPQGSGTGMQANTGSGGLANPQQ